MNPRQRLALIAAAIVILVGGFIVASGSSDDNSGPATTSATGAPSASTSTGDGATTTQAAPKPKPAVPTVVVSGGKPQGGIKKLSFKKGSEARFKVQSDVSDEIHVHGYDFMKDVKAGGSVTFDFPAKIDGRFVVELEGAGVQIAQLEVTP
jgi:hypothetical protein